MKVVGLISGGKDSCFAMMRCIDYGHEIVALANLMPADDAVDELDSYMYQTVGHQIVVSYAECMGLPLFRRRIQGSTRHQHLSYAVTPGDEVEDLFILLNEVKLHIPSIAAVSSGAIASDYQRLRVENVCARLGLVSLAYLWKQDQTFLFEEMIRRGILAVIVKVAAIGLNPTKHLGKGLAELQPQLLQLKELYGVNVCGEGGEYETLTLDCPLFMNARIVLDRFEVKLHSPDSIAPVGILHPLAFHMEHKEEVHLFSGHSIHEVHGDDVPEYTIKCQPRDLESESHTTKELALCISTNNRDSFSIGCWVQASSRTSEGLQEDLTAVLEKIETQLSKDVLGWLNVLYIHLYISDMKQFALANDVYVKFITEDKCYLGVPSRSTIELPLMKVGLGNAYIEVLVANDQKKRVLHVQSMSCWAPSCIGPYSQATLHKEVLYMAGQLGLNPPTMMILSGGPAAEMEQALKNCVAVADCFTSSFVSSAVSVVIYCSASLSTSERTEIQNCLEYFLKNEVSTLQNEDRLKVLDPVFIYVLASSLPKGALVEVKPILHIPENCEGEVETGLHSQSLISEWYSTCCQICNIPGKICTATISITKDVAVKVCAVGGLSNASFSCQDFGKYMKVIAMFCINLLDEILEAKDLSWGDLKNLRFYFTTDLSTTVDVLSLVFSECFKEFAQISGKLVSKDPIFNLVPVLASGRSAIMEDLITCELFASKL